MEESSYSSFQENGRILSSPRVTSGVSRAVSFARVKYGVEVNTRRLPQLLIPRHSIQKMISPKEKYITIYSYPGIASKRWYPPKVHNHLLVPRHIIQKIISPKVHTWYLIYQNTPFAYYVQGSNVETGVVLGDRIAMCRRFYLILPAVSDMGKPG